SLSAVPSGKVMQKLDLANTPKNDVDQYSKRVPGEWSDKFYDAPGRVLGFSSDGETLYFEDEAVKSINIRTGTSVILFDTAWKDSLFSFESQKIAIDMGNDDFVFNWALWNIERGEIEDEFRILPDNFGNLGAGVIANRDVILTPHADRLIFGDSSSRWREFSFSDETLSTPVSSNANGKQWMSMSQDGRYLVTATLSDVRVWNSDAEETSSFRRYRRGDDSFKLPFHQNYRLSFDAIFSEDAKYLFAPDDKGNLSILSLPEYQEVARWSDHKVPLHPWQNTTV
ncbi:MAG: hypothetical protein VCD00_14715, partial [Candidatus Hydrogenedentota bacterium]